MGKEIYSQPLLSINQHKSPYRYELVEPNCGQTDDQDWWLVASGGMLGR